MKTSFCLNEKLGKALKLKLVTCNVLGAFFTCIAVGIIEPGIARIQGKGRKS